MTRPEALIKGNFRISRVDQERLKRVAAEIGKPPSVLLREITCRWLDQQEIATQKAIGQKIAA